MKILYLYSALAQWGGVERVFIDKMNYLAENGADEVYMITTEQGAHAVKYSMSERIHFEDLSIRFHLQYRYRGLRRWYERIRLSRLYKRKLQAAVDSIQPDITICTTSENIGRLLSVRGLGKLLVECHVDYPKASGLMQRLSARLMCHNINKADAFVTLTEGDAACWRRHVRRVNVIPNIVHLNPTPNRASCEAKRAIFVGRFTAMKGINMLFEVWKRIHSQCPDWHLDLYGEGEQWDYYHQQAKSLDLGIDVHEPSSDVFHEYLQSSLLLVTSVYEPFGLVIAEAMSCGLPVVSFDCFHGPRDIITDGQDGFLVPSYDIDAYARLVVRLMGDVELRRRVGLAAIASAQRYHQDNIMPKWKQLFEDVVRT